MSYNPKVSAITATWNRADTLHVPIESMLNQTYENWDMWIIDDASTDNTEEVVGSYNDSRIRYVKLNKQPYYTIVRNKGIKLSDGELLCFRDSDGGCDPKYLERLVKPHKNNDVLVTYCGRKNYVNVDITTISYEDISTLTPKLITPARPYRGRESLSDYIDVGDILIKRSVFKEGFEGFSEEKDMSGYCSDAKLIDSIEKHNPLGRFVMVESPLHWYFYKHGADTENMTDTKIRYREEGNFDNELEAKWKF